MAGLRKVLIARAELLALLEPTSASRASTATARRLSPATAAHAALAPPPVVPDKGITLQQSRAVPLFIELSGAYYGSAFLPWLLWLLP